MGSYKKYLTDVRSHARNHVLSLISERAKSPKAIDAAISKSRGFADGVLAEKGAAIMQVFDIETLSDLGAGTHGVAFDCGNGMVLKVTNDKSEFDNCSNIVGFDIPHVMKVYKVAMLKGKRAYFIQYKKYDLLKSKYPSLYSFFEKFLGNALELISILVNTIVSGAHKSDDFDQKLIKYLDALEREGNYEDYNSIATIANVVFEDEAFSSFSDSQKAFISYASFKNEKGHLRDFFDILSIDENGPLFFKMIAHLMEGTRNLYDTAGIEFTDFHGDNVAVEGDDFVIIDIGHSENHPKPKNYEIIESVNL